VNLAYFVADTLGVTMYQKKDTLIGRDTQQVAWGPWRIGTPITVDSDIIDGRETGLWVSFGLLKLYLIVREKESWLFLLDPKVLATCKVNQALVIERHATKARVTAFKKAIRGVFNNKNAAGWTQIQYDDKTIGG